MSKLPRFVFSPRWIALFLVAVVVAVVCVRLGVWQLHRLDEKRTLNTQVRAGLAQPIAPLPDLLQRADGDPGSLAWHRAEVTGTYDTQHEVLLYGRALNGEPGHHVLTPLVTADGTAVVVDRGWVPFEMDTPPVVEAAPPSGEVTVTGVLLPVEGSGDPSVQRDGSGRLLTVRRIDPAYLAKEMPYDLAPLPLQLQEQSPPQGSDLPAPVPLPELDEGPHLSYAIQWFTFATIALIGYVVLVRREVKDRARQQAGDGLG
jgi:cytochrome oxidase assembly protein ShyY1